MSTTRQDPDLQIFLEMRRRMSDPDMWMCGYLEFKDNIPGCALVHLGMAAGLPESISIPVRNKRLMELIEKLGFDQNATQVASWNDAFGYYPLINIYSDSYSTIEHFEHHKKMLADLDERIAKYKASLEVLPEKVA